MHQKIFISGLGESQRLNLNSISEFKGDVTVSVRKKKAAISTTPGQRRAEATKKRMAEIKYEIGRVLGEPFAAVKAKNGSSTHVLQAILEVVLVKAPIGATEIGELVPYVTKPTVDRHLKKLLGMGLLAKEGRNYIAVDYGEEFDAEFIKKIDVVLHLIVDFDRTTNQYVADYGSSSVGNGNGNGKRRR